jgi:myo-inositol catabolism protein IolC
METIQTLQDAGVEPDVWKVEGLDRQEDCVKLVEIAQRGGRSNVGLIVLGRGTDQDRVVHWLKTAASVPGFIGFAVGRTSFWSSLIDFEAKRLSREEAVKHIGRHFTEWITSFEEARKA